MSANPGAQQGASGHPKPNFRSLADFLSEFRPISYAVAGLMREGSLYTFTGRTGEGKTSFLVILALAVATGQGRTDRPKVKKGRVAFSTAENPDDLRMRLMVACFVFNIDPRSSTATSSFPTTAFARKRSPSGSRNRRSLHPDHRRYVASVFRRKRLQQHRPRRWTSPGASGPSPQPPDYPSSSSPRIRQNRRATTI